MEAVETTGQPKRKIRRIIIDEDTDEAKINEIGEETISMKIGLSTPSKCYPKRVSMAYLRYSYSMVTLGDTWRHY